MPLVSMNYPRAENLGNKYRKKINVSFPSQINLHSDAAGGVFYTTLIRISNKDMDENILTNGRE